RTRLLEPNAEQLSGLLEQLAGLVQLNVKGRYEEELLLREIVKSTPAIAKLRERVAGRGPNALPSEQVALGQLIEREVARHRALDSATALEALQPLAAAAREEEVTHPNA